MGEYLQNNFLEVKVLNEGEIFNAIEFKYKKERGLILENIIPTILEEVQNEKLCLKDIRYVDIGFILTDKIEFKVITLNEVKELYRYFFEKIYKFDVSIDFRKRMLFLRFKNRTIYFKIEEEKGHNMLIDVNINNHYEIISAESTDFDYLEFKKKLQNIFGITIIPSKDKISKIALSLRVIFDYFKDRIESIKYGNVNIDNLIVYINKTLESAKVKSLYTFFDSNANVIKYEVTLTIGKDDDVEYHINDKLNTVNFKYLTFSDIMDKLFIEKYNHK